MARIAARLTPHLLEVLERLDDGRLPIAEICRRVGAEAERRGQLRPSYERIRVLVHLLRALRRRRGPSTARVLLEVTMRARSPEAIVDRLYGAPVRPL